MATKGPEYFVKEEINKQLRSLDEHCWWYMPVAGPYAVAGITDFIGCYRGMMFGLEAKAENGRTTAWQKLHLERINLAGGFGIIVRGVEDAGLVAEQIRAAWLKWETVKETP